MPERALHYTEYDTRLAGYAVIIDADRRILLTWFNGGNPCWSLPGGGVEYGESIEEAIVREVYEESGYHVELDEPLATDVFTRAGDGDRPFKSARVLYSAHIVGGHLGVVEVGGTTDRAEWHSIENLPHDPRARIVDVGIASWRRRESTADPIP